MPFLAWSQVSNSKELDQALSEAQQSRIYDTPIWHGLLHYESGKSSVTSDTFFLSKDENWSPETELYATLEAFLSDAKAPCQFPARKHFLESKLKTLQVPESLCSDYQAYLEGFSADSISLVYASGYLGNPASMFGHVLLKFNKHDSNQLLDHTFSYGAIVPDSDNKLEYIFKGITGGYDGHYANQMYHHQNLLYNESELRDLWEYKLNLPEETATFLLAHLWELEDTQKTYYFFTENCAYQLAKLLELVMGKPLYKKNKLWVMPYDTISMLERSDVNDVIYHGSRQQDLYHKFSELTPEEKMTVEAIILSDAPTIRSLLAQYEDQSAKRIIDTLFDYYAYIESKHSTLPTEQEKIRKELLSQRFQRSPGLTKWKKNSTPPPHKSQDTAMVQINTIHNSQYGLSSELRFRANYYDFLNINTARIPYSELEAFDTRMRYSHSKQSWSVTELTLFNIANLNTSKTGLPEDSGYAWRLASGYKPARQACDSCSTLYFDGFIGKAVSVESTFAAYAALAVDIRNNDQFGGLIKSGPEVGGVLNITPNWAMSFTYGHPYSLSTMSAYDTYVNWEQRFFQNRSFDVRTQVKYQSTLEYSVSLSLYW